MRSVGEHFCGNDSTSKIKNIPNPELAERVTRGISWYDRTRFFLLSLLPFLSSFFGKKEERNEELYEKELLIEKIKISAIRHGGEKQNNYYKTHKGISS